MKKDFSKPKQRILAPSRALLATQPDGKIATATWIKTNEGWKCFSASRRLRWMRGLILAPVNTAKEKGCVQTTTGVMGGLDRFAWHWITPNTGKAITPPFQP